MHRVPTLEQVSTVLALADYVESDDRDSNGEPVTIVKRLEPGMDVWWVVCRCSQPHHRTRDLYSGVWTLGSEHGIVWRCPFGSLGNPQSLYYSCREAAEAFVLHLHGRPWLGGGFVIER